MGGGAGAKFGEQICKGSGWRCGRTAMCCFRQMHVHITKLTASSKIGYLKAKV